MFNTLQVVMLSTINRAKIKKGRSGLDAVLPLDLLLNLEAFGEEFDSLLMLLLILINISYVIIDRSDFNILHTQNFRFDLKAPLKMFESLWVVALFSIGTPNAVVSGGDVNALNVIDTLCLLNTLFEILDGPSIISLITLHLSFQMTDSQYLLFTPALFFLAAVTIVHLFLQVTFSFLQYNLHFSILFDII